MQFEGAADMCYEDWKASLNDTISNIGETDPQRAAMISRRILQYRGTADERNELSAYGIHVPLQMTSVAGLKGGFVGESEAAGAAIFLLKGAIKFIAVGNYEQMTRAAEQATAVAVATMPNGKTITGHHIGTRHLSEPKRSLRSLGSPRYSLLALGRGTFHSQELQYEGLFVNNKFHGMGEATYVADRINIQKYVGEFYDGVRCGRGVLTQRTAQSIEYKYFSGTWYDDKPWSGEYYDTTGAVYAKIRSGEPIPITENVDDVHTPGTGSSGNISPRSAGGGGTPRQTGSGGGGGGGIGGTSTTPPRSGGVGNSSRQHQHQQGAATPEVQLNARGGGDNNSTPPSASASQQ